MPLPAQSEVIGAVNELAGQNSVVVSAAGSLPSALIKLWRTPDPRGYHVVNIALQTSSVTKGETS